MGWPMGWIVNTRRYAMQVNAVMTREVDLVGPNMRLKDAALRMHDDNCGALPRAA